MTCSADSVFAWLEVLDSLTYYELFRIPPGASADEVRTAFHGFCDTFHPDRHIGRSPDERRALSTLFKRGTEGYVVLSDDGLRSHYDAQLAVNCGPAMPRLIHSPLARPPSHRTPGPAPLEDAVLSPSARPFARRAEELLRGGDLRQAKLQLVMASHMDPDNETLLETLRDLEAKLAAAK
jgi:curved DNA-binding protein CbpA